MKKISFSKGYNLQGNERDVKMQTRETIGRGGGEKE